MVPLMHRFDYFVAASAVALALCAGTVHAGLVAQGTRVVFPASEREVTLRISNTSSTPALAQAWIDDGRQDVPPEELQVPFSVTPAVMRVDPNGGAVLRIAYLNTPLPADRESLFWLNILEVPPREEGENNALQFSFRSRLKLFFRPSQLKSVDSAAGELQWKFMAAGQAANKRSVVQVKNPTPYYISFSSVELSVNGRDVSLGRGMVAPFSTKDFDWQRGLTNIGSISVRYEVINDYGGRTTLERALGK
ncbi:TPA: fimbrial biogenesis chaperone [Pseudomonas aeruginosa]|uniref:fimbrial biogenesis chaperone n=1 Tax=Pseudomonas aeruginosa TaxID=287 RepID=UPI000F520E8C|nr:molecular chaperone [Pseudomonas aeruginosa]MBU8393617.1 molecular chaperone [Pseudomonas aeruginosa]RPM78738.1 molecular chaperone [Pseudomonas aeruginosa]RPS00781.1 molecular chaperone [Pseudomonas aeruginosa]HCL3575263.1 molecular chaperone [Pseudomonas aeruginosa]